MFEYADLFFGLFPVDALFFKVFHKYGDDIITQRPVFLASERFKGFFNSGVNFK